MRPFILLLGALFLSTQLQSQTCSGQPDGTPCDDGNACTENDVCTGGTCSGTPKNCDDGNGCTNDSCDPILGCVHTNTTNGIACFDGNACTTSDYCSNGTCTGFLLSCDDGDPNTNDSCDPLSGCVHTPILSVEYSYFIVEMESEIAYLFWETLTEINNHGFEVQKSLDGSTWKTFAFLEGRGTTNWRNQYSYIDPFPGSSTTYYRLKQIDLNGEYQYSNQVEIQSGASSGVTVSYSPDTKKTQLTIYNPDHSPTELTVVDNLGRVHARFSFMNPSSSFLYQFMIETPGVYSIIWSIGHSSGIERIMVY